MLADPSVLNWEHGKPEEPSAAPVRGGRCVTVPLTSGAPEAVTSLGPAGPGDMILAAAGSISRGDGEVLRLLVGELPNSITLHRLWSLGWGLCTILCHAAPLPRRDKHFLLEEELV